jgi:hypothetical protein
VVKITQFINSFVDEGRKEFRTFFNIEREKVTTKIEKEKGLVKVLFIQMELCDENLEAYLSWRKCVDFDKSLKYAHEMIGGLKKMHKKSS